MGVGQRGSDEPGGQGHAVHQGRVRGAVLPQKDTWQMGGLGARGCLSTCPAGCWLCGSEQAPRWWQRAASGSPENGEIVWREWRGAQRSWGQVLGAPALREDRALGKENESKRPVSLPAPSWL